MLTASKKPVLDGTIKVMVVDDSAVIRGLITRMLEEDAGIAVVASVSNGEHAVRTLSKQDIDVIVLDIEMPVMDGLTALPKLLEIRPDVKIIMASTLTVRNAEISIRALSAGAADYVPKPTSSREISGGNDFKRELVEKVKSLGQARIGTASPRARTGLAPAAAPAAAPAVRSLYPGQFTLRAPGKFSPSVLVIGSSTGGPQALFILLKAMKGVRLPILITQHMPATFTTILAEHISRSTGFVCAEGKDGETVQPERVYLAPGGKHMLVEAQGPKVVIRLDDGPPENFCKPAVDPMLRSIAKTYGPRVLTTILTGMGSDGTKGGKAIVDAGGTVIAQDEKTSVVWGMPGAAAAAGVCSKVMPLDELGPYIVKFAEKGPNA